jgi:hypothetical protein
MENIQDSRNLDKGLEGSSMKLVKLSINHCYSVSNSNNFTDASFSDIYFTFPPQTKMKEIPPNNLFRTKLEAITIQPVVLL